MDLSGLSWDYHGFTHALHWIPTFLQITAGGSSGLTVRRRGLPPFTPPRPWALRRRSWPRRWQRHRLGWWRRWCRCRSHGVSSHDIWSSLVIHTLACFFFWGFLKKWPWWWKWMKMDESVLRIPLNTSSTAQGGGGSFKNRKPIGEVGCCESGMAERSHWLTERWLELCLLEWL